ncbi:MAG TPA: hypothetical protein PLJ65_12735 [Casimicrobium sp.]|nr:hypothetical protein [Casimicrobium sp.]
MAQITTLSKLRFPLLALVLTAISATATAAPKIAEGAYRVDWNRKVRDLCVDNYTNDDLTARDWQGVLAALGSICTLSNVREGKTDASWSGKCSQPGVGRVLDVKYDVSVKVNADGSFDILTVISGDQQARIPIRGERLKGAAAACSKEQPFFRPWQ